MTQAEPNQTKALPFPSASGWFCRVVENPDFGLRRAQNRLGALQGISGRKIRVLRGSDEQIRPPHKLHHAGIFQDTVDLLAQATDQQIAPFLTQKLDQLLQRHHAGGIQVARIFHPQDNNPQVGVRCGLLDLIPEQFRRAKKKAPPPRAQWK